MAALCARNGLSSAHVNFHRDDEDAAFDDDWLPRIDVQYHWRNDARLADFDDFLAAFDHKHRKNIRQERAKVARAGVTFRVVARRRGQRRTIWRRCTASTCRPSPSTATIPALTLEFLRHLARDDAARRW